MCYMSYKISKLTPCMNKRILDKINFPMRKNKSIIVSNVLLQYELTKCRDKSFLSS